MISQKKGLIVANWKMNHSHLEAIHTIQKFSYAFDIEQVPQSKVVICPSFTSLRSVQTIIESDELPVLLGAQDVSENKNGAYTGDVSAEMLSQLRAKFVIVGHSERRKYHNESNELILKKAKMALSFGITPIVCVGEIEENDGLVEEQVNSIKSISDKIVVAYEPVWAIGTGKSASVEHIEKVSNSISDIIGFETTLLYGGSADIKNASLIMGIDRVGGLLVGSASLDGENFAKLIYASLS